MPLTVDERALQFNDVRERKIFERIRDWWARGGRNVAPLLYSGLGDPNTVVTAGVGSLYLRTNGGAATTLYIKESGTGNTGWVAK